MNLRQNTALRGLARRLPLLRSYEERIEELTGQVEALSHAGAPGVPSPVADASLWVPPGHFYSPFPDLEEMDRRQAEVFGRDPFDVAAVDLAVDAQAKLLDELEPLVAGVEFPLTATDAQRAGVRYWTDNPAYGAGDALFLLAMLRHLRPPRVLELGSGYSSACTLDARDELPAGEMEVTFVDPYPELLHSVLRPGDLDTITVLPIGSQDLDHDAIASLQAGDVLFIDSTHVSKPGSDVNRNLFEILPALNPGVVIHLHDIFPGFEYPRSWVDEGRGWTELYLLRAFLQYNEAFEILLWPGLMWSLAPEEFERRFPPFALNRGGAIWLRKRF